MGGGLLIDTGFFFVLFDERNSNPVSPHKRSEWLEILSIILPVLCKALNMRFPKRRTRLDPILSGP